MDFSAWKSKLESGSMMKDWNSITTTAFDVALPLTIDWASLESAPNQARVQYFFGYWDSYAVVHKIAAALSQVSREMEAKDWMKEHVKSITIKHVNEGREESERVEFNSTTGELSFLASFCCTWHFLGWQIEEVIARKLKLDIPYYKKLLTEKAVQRAQERINTRIGDGANVTVEVDIKSFETPYNLEDKAQELKYVQVLQYATRYNGYYSVGSVGEAFYYLNSDVAGKDLADAFTKIVVHHAPGDDYYKDRSKRRMKYDQEHKVLHITNCHEMYYWGNFDYWSIAQFVRRVIKMNKIMGTHYDKLSAEQSAGKLELLKDLCESQAVADGNLEEVIDFLKWPACYKPDNREKKAFKMIMKMINTPQFKDKWNNGDDDDDDAPTPAAGAAAAAAGGSADADKKKDDVKPAFATETFVAGWRATKFNYKGMQQERLVVVTSEATYTISWDFKSNKPTDDKRIHRIRHNMYSYIDIGELKPASNSVPGLDADKLAKIEGALGAVEVTQLCRYRSNWPTKDARKKKEFKMPEIPDLKKNIVAMFRKIVDGVKSIEFPKFDPPGMPSFDLPNLMDMIGKKSIDRLPTPSLPQPGVATTSNFACDAFLAPPPESLGKFDDLKKKVADKSKPDNKLGLPNMPDFGVPAMLNKIADFIDGLTDINLSLPKEFTLPGILKAFGKAVKKGAGVTAGKMGPLNPIAAMTMIKEKIEDSDLAKDIDECIETMKNASLPDIEFPDLPDIDFKKLIKAIMEPLSKVTLPVPDINVKEYLPNLPDLPSVNLPNAPNMPNMPGAGFMKKFKKTEPYPNIEMTLRVHTDPLQSSHLAQEVAWVVWALARAFNRPMWPSTPSQRTLDGEVTMGAKLYNKLGKGKDNKPSKDISDEEANKVDDADVAAAVAATATPPAAAEDKGKEKAKDEESGEDN